MRTGHPSARVLVLESLRFWARTWNGKFRDDVRSFVRGEPGKVGALMQRLYGSDDLFPDGLQETCRPHQSVNFVTAHDGFCLHDLLAYDRKKMRPTVTATRTAPTTT
jgi:pullulanase/glycogen debranching enzyme